MLNKNKYSPINSNKSKYFNLYFFISKIINYYSYAFFIIIYYLYYLSLERCLEGERKCGKKGYSDPLYQ
jgi:hypothetical protein